jgi:hypothetical protein
MAAGRAGRKSASLAFERGAAAVALDVHLEDGGVMNQAVDDSDRHCLVREDFAPFAEGLVCCDEERAGRLPRDDAKGGGARRRAGHHAGAGVRKVAGRSRARIQEFGEMRSGAIMQRFLMFALGFVLAFTH